MTFIYELLHAFGAGIAFAAGITIGATLMQLANRQARKEMIAASGAFLSLRSAIDSARGDSAPEPRRFWWRY